MAASGVSTAPARRALPIQRPDFGRRGRGIGLFLMDVRAELRKVVWPTRREAATLSALVVLLSFAVGLILGGIDFVFAELFRLLLRS